LNVFPAHNTAPELVRIEHPGFVKDSTLRAGSAAFVTSLNSSKGAHG
jgi:hypothetical protein